MADFIFRISPNVVLGSYVVTRVPQYVKEYGSRFMVVMDPVLKDVGLADKILQPLNERNVDYFIFDEAQHCGSPIWGEIIGKLSELVGNSEDKKMIGATATRTRKQRKQAPTT